MHKSRSTLRELEEGGFLNNSHPTCQSLPFYPVQVVGNPDCWEDGQSELQHSVRAAGTV